MLKSNLTVILVDVFDRGKLTNSQGRGQNDRDDLTKKQENKDSPSIWNVPELLARIDNDHELLRDLLAIFHEDCPGHISSLEKAIGVGDLKSAAAEAHTLKGMLANLAAARAATAAGRLERLARDGEKGSLYEAFEALQLEMNSLSQEFAAHRTAVRT